MRIAVTGARGFTGRYVLDRLCAQGDEPVALAADVRDAAALRTEVRAIRPDAAIHLAARAFVQSDDVDGFYAVNQLGSFAVLDALAAAAPGIPVLLASSAQVYGAQATGLIDEAAPMQPANHYALSKAAMELGARLWADRLAVTIARPFNYTGVGQEDRYLIAKVVAHVRRREPVIELGNIDVARDFGDVRSVADAYAGLIRRGAPGTFNIATGRVTTVRQVIDLLAELTGHRPEVRVNPAFVRAQDVPVLGGRNDALRAALPEWTPIALTDTLAWMLDEAG